MARFSPLFSSSSANSFYIGCGAGSVLIDCGASAKRITEALCAKGVDPKEINGICITHEHSDHVSGLRVLASKYNIPVYATEGTLEALTEAGIVNGKFPVNVIGTQGTEIGGMKITAFATSHDSRQSCGYRIETSDSRTACVCTDLGIVTPEVMSGIASADLTVIESNHDVNMLQNGGYPYNLKRRILSPSGHLSNETCAETVKQLIETGTTRFILAHLSRENNFPDLAYETTAAALCACGAKIGTDCLLSVAKPIDAERPIIF